jgi:hypothetical protein
MKINNKCVSKKKIVFNNIEKLEGKKKNRLQHFKNVAKAYKGWF